MSSVEAVFISVKLPFGWRVLCCPLCHRAFRWQWLGTGWTIPEMWKQARIHVDDAHPEARSIELIDYGMKGIKDDDDVD